MSPELLKLPLRDSPESDSQTILLGLCAFDTALQLQWPWVKKIKMQKNSNKSVTKVRTHVYNPRCIQTGRLIYSYSVPCFEYAGKSVA
jgi:hypothetical protein